MNKLCVTASPFLQVNLFLLNQKNIFKFTILKTNYSFFLLSLSTIFPINSLFNSCFIRSLSFIVKKHNLHFEHFLKKNNSFFYRKKYIFNKNYKFNKFFFLTGSISLRNVKKPNLLNSPFSLKNFSHLFFAKFIFKFLSKKSFKIVGNLLSPFS